MRARVNAPAKQSAASDVERWSPTTTIGRRTRIESALRPTIGASGGSAWASPSAPSSLPNAPTAHPREREAEETAGALVDAYRAGSQPGGSDALTFFVRSLGLEHHAPQVHTDARARSIASAHGAAAVTTGRDIYFGRSQLDTSTHRGLTVLAHEVAHVAQHARDPGAMGGHAWRVPTGPSARGAQIVVSVFGLRITFAEVTEIPTIHRAIELLLDGLIRSSDSAAIAEGLVEALGLHLVGQSITATPTVNTAAANQTQATSASAGTTPNGSSGRAYFELDSRVAWELVQHLALLGHRTSLSEDQRRTLRRAYYASIAYESSATAFPELADRARFLMSVRNRGVALDEFGVAHERYVLHRSEENQTSRARALDLLVTSVRRHARILEALRTNPHLRTHPVYGVLFPGEEQATSAGLREAFLTFTDAMPERVDRALEEPTGRALGQLLDDFARSFAASMRRGTVADDFVGDTVSRVARPALPGALRIEPGIVAPGYRAVSGAEYRFTVWLDTGDLVELDRYRYRWEVARLPYDPSVVGTWTRPDDPIMSSEPLATEHPHADIELARAQSEDVALDFERDDGADVGRAREERSRLYAREERQALGDDSSWGDDLTFAAARMFRPDPDARYEVDAESPVRTFVFRRPGVYVVRCIASMVGAEDLRAPTEVRQTVAVMSAITAGQEELDAMRAESERSRATVERMQVLGALMGDGAEADALERELDLMRDEVGFELERQRRLIQARLEQVPSFLAEHRSLLEQLAGIDRIIARRAEHGVAHAGAHTERLLASFVTDTGDRIPLLFEITETGEGVMISDLTTPRSSRSRMYGGPREGALRRAVYEILSGEFGYGPGVVTFDVGGETVRLRVTRSAGQLRREALDNAATVLQLTALALAPVTEGATLALLPLLGMTQAVHGGAGYRLEQRLRDDTLTLDVESFADGVTLLGAVAGLGELTAVEGAAGLRAIGGRARGLASTGRLDDVARAFRLIGRGADVAESALMAQDTLTKLDAIARLPPGERLAAFRRLVIELLPAGVMLVASHVSSNELARRQDEAQTGGAGDAPPRTSDVATEPTADSYVTRRGVPVRTVDDLIAGEHDIGALSDVLPSDVRDAVHLRRDLNFGNGARVEDGPDGVAIVVGPATPISRLLLHVDAARSHLAARSVLGRIRSLIDVIASALRLRRRMPRETGAAAVEIDFEIAKYQELLEEMQAFEAWAAGRVAQGAQYDATDAQRLRVEVELIEAALQRQRDRIASDGAFGFIASENTLDPGGRGVYRMDDARVATLPADAATQLRDLQSRMPRSPAELEALVDLRARAAGLPPGARLPLEPGTPEHTLDRWRRYEGGQSFERWMAGHPSRMANSRRGIEIEQEYRTALSDAGVSARGSVVTGELRGAPQTRQVDVMIEGADETRHLIQIKSGSEALSTTSRASGGSSRGASSLSNHDALLVDQELVRDGARVTWVFEGHASGPLVRHALDCGVTVVQRVDATVGTGRARLLLERAGMPAADVDAAIRDGRLVFVEGGRSHVIDYVIGMAER